MSTEPECSLAASPPPLGRVKRFFAVLGGADPRILNQAPATAFKFVELSLVLLGTAAIAGLSMAFALTSGVHLPVGVAVPLALVWMLVILNLDRFLTSQIKATRSWLRLLGQALPRVVLAVLIGVVVAVPMTIRVFQTEVDAEVAKMTRERSAMLTSELGSSNLASDLHAAEERLQALRTQAQTGAVDPAQDGRVKAAQETLDRAKAASDEQEATASEAERLFQCEVYGNVPRERLKDPTKCAAKPGWNGMARQYQAEAERARADAKAAREDYLQAQEKLTNAQATVSSELAVTAEGRRSEAEAAIPAEQEKVDALRAELDAEATSAREKVSAATGLLAQIEALERLSSSPAMGRAHLAVILLFTTVELLPVIVKVFMAYGDRSLYEIMDDAETSTLAREAQIRREREVKRVESEAERDLAVEADMLKREKALGIEANEFVQQQMHGIINSALMRWSAQVNRTISQADAAMPRVDLHYPSQAIPGGSPVVRRPQMNSMSAPLGGIPDPAAPRPAPQQLAAPATVPSRVARLPSQPGMVPQSNGMLTSGFPIMDAQDI